jgi:predicted  nucleic acid-binding Zn-ribbon protein
MGSLPKTIFALLVVTLWACGGGGHSPLDGDADGDMEGDAVIDGDAVDGDTADGDADADTPADGDMDWEVDADRESDADSDGGAGCIDDPLEDNDDIASASPVDEGDYTGLRVCPLDEDFFAIDLDGGEVLNVDLAFTHATGDIDLSLLDPSGAIIVSSNTSGDAESFTFPVVVPGTYTILVALYGESDEVPGNDYTMWIEVLDSPPPCRDDPFEDNDDDASATGLGTGEFRDLRLCPGDDDYFVIDVHAGATLTVALAFEHDDGNIDVELIDPTGSVVATGESTDDDETVTLSETVEGSYLVRVILRSDPSADGNGYTMVIDVQYTSTECVDDRYEDNDVLLAATPLGEGTHPDLRVCFGDADYYSYDLRAGDRIEVTLEFSHAEGNINLYLFDPGGVVVATSGSTTDVETVTHIAATTGTYRIAVGLIADSGIVGGNGYELTIVHEPAVITCTDDRYEENDTSATARAMPEGTYSDLRICPGNDDYYSYDMAVGERLAVYLVFPHAEGDINAYIRDPSGTVVASGESEGDAETMIVTARSAGRYTIHVHLDADTGGVVGNDYDMSIVHDPVAPPCTDDSYEDNDTVATAVDLPAGTHRDLRICPGDDDYYAFDLAVGDTILVWLTYPSAEGNIDLRLLDPRGTVVAASVDDTGTDWVNYVAATAGTYRIRFNLAADRGATTGNGYAFSIVHTPVAPACTDDAYEDNDTVATARRMAAGTYPRLRTCPGDDDYYSFDLALNDRLAVYLDFTNAEGNINLYLIDPTGAVVASSERTDDAEVVFHTAARAGTYAIRVRLVADAGATTGNEYEMRIVHTPFVPTCTDDRYEDNDTFATATVVVEGSYLALQVCPADDDYYAYTLAVGDRLTVNLTFSHAEGNVDAYLLDPSGTIVARGESLTNNETLDHTAVVAGTFRIRVVLTSDGGAGAGNAYDMSIAHDPAPAVCSEDRYEDNDWALAGTPVTAGTYSGLRSCPGDLDYYTFALAVGDTLRIDLAFTHAEGNIDLRLIDPGLRIVASSLSTANSESITYVATSAGTHYIQVSLTADSGATIGNGYTMTITHTPAVGPCVDDAFEDNDSSATATRVAPGSYPDLQSCPDDHDFYVLTLAPGESVAVNLYFSHAEGNIDMRLLDSVMRTVASSTGTTDNESLSYTSTEVGTYYIRVYLTADSGTRGGNTYDMAIGTTDYGCAGHPDMARITALGVCIDRFEASLGSGGRAVSAPGVAPWASVTQAQAAAACAAAGKRLCTYTEWNAACEGLAGNRYPYGPVYDDWACNGADRREGRALETATLATCEGGYDGIFDMSGNLWEWTNVCSGGLCHASGGSYYDIFGSRLHCESVTDRDPSTAVLNIGFRCCLTP